MYEKEIHHFFDSTYFEFNLYYLRNNELRVITIIYNITAQYFYFILKDGFIY